MDSKVAIITGITGQDGAYLSALLLQKNYKVVGVTRSSNNANRHSLSYLGIAEQVRLEECDLTDLSAVIKLLTKYRPSEIYNLAAQSSVGLSFEQPIGTVTFNITSVLNLLEAIRIADKNIRFYQASSSEMYGKVKNLPIDEDTPMHPLSPYAISKASAHWIVINYREAYGLYACCGVLFNHESYLRSGNFFVKKVLKSALDIKNNKQDLLEVGNIDIKRDFGYAQEYVQAMWLMLQQPSPEDFIICSGSSISLHTIVSYIFEKLGLPQERFAVSQKFFRPTDIEDIYGNNTKAKLKLGWHCTESFFEVLDKLIQEEILNYDAY